MSNPDRSIRLPKRPGCTVACMWLGMALLAAGCARFTYDPTPTAAPYVAPPPTATLATAAPPPAPSSTPTPLPEGPTILRVGPSVVNVNVGETRPVEVWLDNAEELHSIELHISFDPGYVRVEDADPDTAGEQISAGVMPVPAQVLQNEVDNDAGLITYHVAKDAESLGSRSGTVASFTVRGVAEGGSPLRFNVAMLLDSEGQPLEVQNQVDGIVTVGVGDDDDTPGPTSEPTPTPTSVAETPASSTPTPSPVPAGPSTANGVYYTVQPGENLFRIALRYGTTVNAIVAANDLPDQDAVQAGQTLLIPVSPSAGRTTYVVQPGDTVYSIARRFGTTVETLVALNGLDSSYSIKSGQTLIIAP